MKPAKYNTRAVEWNIQKDDKEPPRRQTAGMHHNKKKKLSVISTHPLNEKYNNKKLNLKLNSH